ncbi:serine hydrolase domain-containing protein [Pseudomarimonas salicorniae]|uniref:Beta-lactamase n=1 Tax=Pseudomarimonas salicorniae TaxID=2933270 RepID=A0ABT0GFV3_9GAMM|nr:serine hydrolase domain-containing protein [Lysobacter sp. CAU 1642]MCK7593423.1 beta-lactamase family protein [Lysobacter sp. CAU 1642]
MLPTPLISLALSVALVSPGMAMDDAALAAKLASRLDGDRTGACFAAAVIDAGGVSRAVACADPDRAGKLDAATAFEIGSVSKTFNGLLLQQLVEAGKLSLDDPAERHLPEGVSLSRHGEAPITLRHLLTHTSGLPSLAPGWQIRDPSNPYRDIDRKALYAGLDGLRPRRAPGEAFEYSNLGAMLLSDIIGRVAGKHFDALVAEQVFAPLGMRSFVGKPPKGVERVTGHLPNGESTSAWDFDPALAGVGGVRASLDDMVRYLEAQMGRRESPLDASIRASQQPVHVEGQPPMAMGWMIAPLNGARVLAHEGGTGGFSSFVAFRADRSRGVVVLSDTAMTSLGGLGSVGLHLLDERVPLGEPRRVASPPVELLDKLAGDWRLEGGLKMSLRQRDGALEIQAEGQPAFEMRYDSAGDFYPLAFDAVLRPQVNGERVGFIWLQGGAATPASRIEAGVPTAEAAALADYAGRYPLMPGFALKVFVENATLMAQATGQGAFALAPAGEDVFRADAFGIEIRFDRGEDGAVRRLALHQGGQVMRGERNE